MSTPPDGNEKASSSGKREVTRLPSSDSASSAVAPAGSRNDLSAGATADIPGIIAEDIKDRRRLRWFQTLAFYGAFLLIAVTFFMLFQWVNLIATHLADGNVTTTYRVSFFIAPIVVLGTLGALLTLALLKFAFRPPGKEEEDPSPITMFHGLLQQVVDIGKDYLKAKKGGE
ncbi:hypothetical protein [Burkholderia multivorans]|uniref:Uncharacterized protein n=2 Tax=root TaxID=1 RepID=A0A9E7SKX5_9CAUD|nr:hypothetical protein [Burkholderia multivorans]MBU9358786.1 hypothetical protein [Burkholderia multivorans]MDN7437034.1 hypothetical protein [Burkholderia multivorans]USM11603.1 hypothetical protein Carl1_2 [Burkholderia phage Carl1]